MCLADLSRAGFIIFALAFLGGYFMGGVPGPTPGFLMGAGALLPLAFGSRVQRIAAVFCLLCAAACAHLWEQQAEQERERHARLQQILRQRSTSP